MEIAIANLLCVTILTLVYKFGYKRVILDSYRQKLFLIRNELFDLKFIEKSDITEDKYRAIENLLNSNIRFAHRVSLISNILILHYTIKRHNKVFEKVTNDYLSIIDYLKLTRKQNYLDIVNKLQNESAKYLILSSPFIFSIVLIINIIINFFNITVSNEETEGYFIKNNEINKSNITPKQIKNKINRKPKVNISPIIYLKNNAKKYYKPQFALTEEAF